MTEDDIIANERAFRRKKDLIAVTPVLKDKPNRKDHKFFNLPENGIIFICLKQNKQKL